MKAASKTESMAQGQLISEQHSNINDMNTDRGNLSAAALAEIEAVRDDVEKGYIDQEQADSHIRVIMGRDTGKGHLIAQHTNKKQMNIAYDRISKIGTLLHMTSENISQKIYDDCDGPQIDVVLNYDDAENIIQMLEIAKSSLNEAQSAVSIICAA